MIMWHRESTRDSKVCFVLLDRIYLCSRYNALTHHTLYHSHNSAAEERRKNPPRKLVSIMHEKEKYHYVTTPIRPQLLSDAPGNLVLSHYAVTFEETLILRSSDLQLGDVGKDSFLTIECYFNILWFLTHISTLFSVITCNSCDKFLVCWQNLPSAWYYNAYVLIPLFAFFFSGTMAVSSR